MNENGMPLVSCIMPTYNRRRFVPYAIEYFLRQEYSNKELIIIDDGEDAIEDLIPRNPAVRYYRLNEKITLGAKLNLACSYARGEIIANWDDDDWYAKTRLQYQVNALINDKTEVCGINNLLYYDLQHNIGYRYIYPSDQRPWLLGSSLCYTKELWRRNQFADINVGMDALFVWATSPECVKALTDFKMSVHMIHGNNVSPKKTDNEWWHSYPVDEIQKIMKKDWLLYKSANPVANKIVTYKQNVSQSSSTNNTEPLKNIYACLVHENEACIIDLVRNLHYHDPSSVILLFNGGNNASLFSNDFPYDKFGTVIHPKPFPIKHGYLHSYALSCMQFSLDNFSFDAFTVVDSDQLAIRSGYSYYLKESFSSLGNVGMFSRRPKRVTAADAADGEVWPAIQAFNEYDLWKPLLQQFKNGEDKFVHWTFWPSSVFTPDTTKDLVKVFRDNNLLNSIMKQTKLWATEEVVLSTMVALLGYEIALNPCSYEFVKYKKTFSVQDVQSALNTKEAYWIHPVNREYNDPLRKMIRENFNHYTGKLNKPSGTEVPGELFRTLPLLNKIREIEGWLSDEEADLLISTAITMCMKLPQPHTIAEVGCYHGKSTVILASILKQFSPANKIYSIDPHDGKQGAVDVELQTFPPSYDSFIKNIQGAGINGFVEIIKDQSCNVKWDRPIALLFIDGLHDYINVSKDFRHFEQWIVKNGYVVFHDYADYYPGVQALVNELLNTEEYEQVYRAESLIVIKNQVPGLK